MIKWNWPDFAPHEVLSPDGLAQFKKGNLMVQPFALDALQSFRSRIAVPVLVNFSSLQRRGYRSPKENMQIKGAEFSRHVQGIAFDITAPDMTPEELFHAAIQHGFGGVGLYKAQNFVHVDVRAKGTEPITWIGKI